VGPAECKILDGKLEGKRSLVRPRNIWNDTDNIKMNQTSGD
jgi:hypothetical protein